MPMSSCIQFVALILLNFPHAFGECDGVGSRLQLQQKIAAPRRSSSEFALLRFCGSSSWRAVGHRRIRLTRHGLRPSRPAMPTN